MIWDAELHLIISVIVGPSTQTVFDPHGAWLYDHPIVGMWCQECWSTAQSFVQSNIAAGTHPPLCIIPVYAILSSHQGLEKECAAVVGFGTVRGICDHHHIATSEKRIGIPIDILFDIQTGILERTVVLVVTDIGSEIWYVDRPHHLVLLVATSHYNNFVLVERKSLKDCRTEIGINSAWVKQSRGE